MISGWRVRISEELKRLPKRSALICSRFSGIDALSEVVYLPELPVLSLWIESAVSDDEFNRLLLRSFERALGVTALDSEMDLLATLDALSEYQARVGPFYLVCGWVEACGRQISQLLASLRNESHVLMVAESMDALVDLSLQLEVVDGTFMTMTLEEALLEFQGVVDPSEIAAIHEGSNGEFTKIQMLVLQAGIMETDSSIAGPAGGWRSRLTPKNAIDGLVKRGMWAQAFDLVCQHEAERLPTIIDSAGHALFNRGLHGYLFRRISGLPPALLEEPKIAYWQFAAASAIGAQWTLMPRVNRILASNEAPELRAVVSMARPGNNMLEETSRALSKLTAPVTLRAHGLCLAMAGEIDMPQVMYRECMRMADAEGMHHLLIASIMDIAYLELLRGNYQESIEWGQKALTEMAQRNVSDDMRRLSIVAAIAFGKVLAGDLDGGRDLLSGLRPGRDHIHVPGIEALASTIGDVALLDGNFSEAEEMYKYVLESAPIEVVGSTTLGLIALEICRGDSDAAQRYGMHAFSISKGASDHEQGAGELALGMALAKANPGKAESHLERAYSALRPNAYAWLIAQSAIWLAMVRISKGEVEKAATVLAESAAYLEPLGLSGWRLLSANYEGYARLQTLFRQSRSSAQIKFLKTSYIRLDNERIDLPVKQAEIIALLALYPDGLSAERLDDLQFGSGGDSNRTKVAVSRLRKEIPISTAPYRLTVPFKADFIEASKLLEAGQLQKALNLYTGPLLPLSESPTIVEHRAFLEESFRQTALSAKDSDALIQLGTVLDDDLEIWLAAKAHLPPGDYRGPAIAARIRRIKAGW